MWDFVEAFCMLSKIILFIKRLFGLLPSEKDLERRAASINAKIKRQEQKLKEIENEKHDLDSLVDELNK